MFCVIFQFEESKQVNPGLKTLGDAELVAQIVDQGSEAASTVLFHRYRKKIYIWAFNIAHDREEAVDLTQEVFIRIFRGLGGYDGRAQFSTWVYSIARNHCLSVVGTKKNRWRKKLAAMDDFEAEDLSFSNGLQQAQIAGELDEILIKAGKLMKELELEAFILHFRDGLTVKEISRTLGCTNTSGARSLIQNASRKFKRMVGRKDRTGD